MPPAVIINEYTALSTVPQAEQEGFGHQMHHRHRAGECRKEQGNDAAWRNGPEEQNDKCIVQQQLQNRAGKSPCRSRNFTLRGAKANVPFACLCVLTFKKGM